ncbi:MAG: hypothetical protein IJC50_10215 [Clostridia bacterium]|nr:hypothetical protein [Clostridia bacterium]
MNKSNLIVMLTHNDYTVHDAIDVFNTCKHLPVEYWGAKEQGISPQELKRLFDAINESRKTSVLEVVAYTENDCLDGAKLGIECGCDILLGTKYFDSVNDLCRSHNVKYMPFAGDVSGRPSVLKGSVNDILSQAEEYRKKGVHGVDLLGYRYTGNTAELCRTFADKFDLPVCLAGSINTIERLNEVLQINPEYFTIGSAFFEHSFGHTIPDQIESVCTIINQQKP